MAQRFKADGSVCPVTAIQAGPCVVVQVKTTESDGYDALQLGYGEKKNISKPLAGHFKKAKEWKAGRGFRFMKEIRNAATEKVTIGDVADITNFNVGDFVTVVGHSKGRGFTGVVKRHHFRGHPSTHGHKDQERMPGSIGAGGVQRVFKGKRMAGRMGNQQVTVKNLEIIDIDQEKGLLFVGGAVPGARNGFLVVSATKGDMEYKKSKNHESPQTGQAGNMQEHQVQEHTEENKA